MTQPPRISARPKRFPPPEFPPRRPKLFARTPPAVFPSILGLLGLAGAVRLMLGRLGLGPAWWSRTCASCRGGRGWRR